jgi:hypothetical protein
MNDRIVTLDFVKGVLVLCMVIYHGLNYLGYDAAPHFYLLFLPPSFILIAGFIITHIYVSRYGISSHATASRLALRSCKLLLLFTLLNVGVALVFSSRPGMGDHGLLSFAVAWREIYVAGGSRSAAFEVLLPIGYLLLLAVPILRFQAYMAHAVVGITLATVTVCFALDRYGYPAYNLYMISAGLTGMSIGLLPDYRIKGVSLSPIVQGSLYAFFWIVFYLYGDRYPIQLIASLVCVLIIASLGSRIDTGQWLLQQLLLLGRYSLLAYIIQIFYLQIFKRAFFSWGYGVSAIAVIIATTILTWGTVRIGEHARKKSALIDHVYRAIFA